jgi:hypothetical protein
MINFPDNPTVNQTFTAAGVTWVWDGIKWNMSSIAGSSFIFVSTAPPTNPTAGALWWDSIGGQLYIYFNDGNSLQWVSAANQGFGGTYLPLVGGSLSGPLILAADPVNNLGAATKQYVDKNVLNSNRIINGDMRIDQRNNGATFNGQNAYLVDRWLYIAPAGANQFNWSRNLNNINGPIGFPYYLGAQSNSAHTALAIETFYLEQRIEADMVSDFAWGTPQAQPITLSFWIYSSLTGTFSGAILNMAGTRSYPFSFSAPIANTWTKIIITIPGDTGGVWVMSSNAAAIRVAFDYGCGATYRGSVGAWTSTPYFGVTGAVSVNGTNAAILYLTGVKLEIGSVATPFNKDSLAKSMADCQRYYQYLQNVYLSATVPSGNAFNGFASLPVKMRATPTAALGAANYAGCNSFSINNLSDNSFMQQAISAQATMCFAYCAVYLSAEL